MSSSNPLILVISLPHSQDRQAHISEQMQRLGLQYEFIEAIDGRSISEEKMAALDVDVSGSPILMPTRHLTKGEIGCALSHRRAYRRIVDDCVPLACILEDDAVLTDSFVPVLNCASLSAANWEMLLLGHFSNSRRSSTHGGECSYFRRRLTPAHWIARPVEFPYLAIGYLLRLTAARKLLEASSPIRMPADALTGRAEMYDVRLRLVTPPCVLPRDDFVANSTIGERRDDVLAPAASNGRPHRFMSRLRASSAWKLALLGLRKLGILRPPYRKHFLPETHRPLGTTPSRLHHE